MNIFLLKNLLRLVSVLMILTMVAIGSVYYLLSSERGAKLVLTFAGPYLEENLSLTLDYREASGTIMRGLSFEQLEITHSAFMLQADSLTSDWSLWALLDKEIDLERLQIDALNLTLVASADGNTEQGRDITDLLSTVFNLPVNFTLNALILNNPAINLDSQVFALNALNASLGFDAESLHVNALNIDHDNFTLTGALALQAGDYTVDGNLDWTFINDSTLALSADPLNGSLFFSGNINTLEVSHELNNPLQLSSDGSFSTGLLDGTGISFSFEHSLNDISGFLPEQIPVTGLSGNLLTHGSPALVFIDADLDLQSRQFAPVNLLLSGEYQNQSLSFETINARSEEIDLQALANISLQPFNLRVDWGLNNLVLADTFDAFTLSDVNGGGSLVMDDAGNTDVSLSFLTARLNGYPLDAEGLLSIRDNTLSSMDLALSAGTNRLDMEGDITDEIDINWLINAPDLSVWLPTLSGEIIGNGLVSGQLDSPQITGTLQVANLDYRDGDNHLALQNLSANIVTAQNDYQFTFSLSGLIAEIAENEIQVSTGDITWNGTASDHQGAVSFISDPLSADLTFSGAYANDVWQGAIAEARLDSDYGNWTLQTPMNASLANGTVNIFRHCWSYLETGLCLSAGFNDDMFTLNTALTDFPLAYLNTPGIVQRVDSEELTQRFSGKPQGLAELQQAFDIYFPDNTFIEGMLDADLGITGLREAPGEADFVLDLRPGNLNLNLFLTQEDAAQSVQPEIRTFRIEPEVLTLSRRAASITGNAGFSISHSGDSGFDVQGDVASTIAIDPMENLQGEVVLNFSSLDWLETLLPEIRNTRGQLSGRLELLGSIAQPRFISDLRLSNGSFELPRYGINPDNITVDFISDDQQNLLINASARSGQGELTFSGRAASLYTTSRNFQFSLLGEDFSLIDNTGTHVVISPDLQLDFRNNALDLQGRVDVTELELDIRENDTVLLSTGVDVSRDVVIVNAPPEQAALVSNSSARDFQDIPLTANLELALGDDVHFQGLGLDLMLAGNLQLQQDLDRPLLAYGDISITEGVYEIYGQQLDVSNGKLIFFGNPTNPALDIRAYRQDSEIQAGVQINGTLRNMQSQLFSTPSLPESEILSILITGKSYADTDDQDQINLVGAVTSLGLSRGQGITNTIRSELGLDSLELNSQSNFEQSSLGLGKYLTPDIFMHYEIGLFDKENILSLDYILSDRLRLEVESGISQSIDLTYKVEK